MFSYEDFKKYERARQYQLNERDQWIASQYGDKLTFNEVMELRLIALRQSLIKHNVEVITDIPYGKGLLEYRNKWEQMMKEAVIERSC